MKRKKTNDENKRVRAGSGRKASKAKKKQELNAQEKGKKVKRAENRYREFQRFGIHAFLFIIVLFVLFSFFVGFMSAPNNDMYPRIDAGDLLLFYRLDKDPKAQDVIVFEKNGTRYVGRVIAVQKDTVEITEGGSVMVNNNSLIESNIFFETYPLTGYTQFPLTLGSGKCFVLMDSRRGAEDSRYFGPVDYSEIVGTVITVFRRNNL